MTPDARVCSTISPIEKLLSTTDPPRNSSVGATVYLLPESVTVSPLITPFESIVAVAAALSPEGTALSFPPPINLIVGADVK